MNATLATGEGDGLTLIERNSRIRAVCVQVQVAVRQRGRTPEVMREFPTIPRASHAAVRLYIRMEPNDDGEGPTPPSPLRFFPGGTTSG